MEMNKENKLKIAVGLGIILLLGIAYAMKSELGPKDSGMIKPSGEYAAQEGAGAAVPGAKPDEAAPGDSAVAPRQATIALMDGPTRVGSATLTDIAGNNTRIVITMNRADRDESLPAAIHGGNCADTAQETQYPLNPVVKGTSVTELNVNIGALIDQAPQSIRIKSDAVDAKAPLAACGNLK